MNVAVSSPATAATREVVVELIRTVPRLVRWQPMLGAVAAAVALLVWRYDAITSADPAIWMLRFTGVILVVGAVFALDDASRNVTDSAPTPLPLRSGLRLALMVATIAVTFVPLVAVITSRVSLGKTWWGVVLEIVALIAVASAFSLTMQRWRGMAEPGQFAGISVIATMLAANIIGARWPMLASPGEEWRAAHQRWAGLLVLALLLTLWQLRDPAAGPWRSALRRQ